MGLAVKEEDIYQQRSVALGVSFRNFNKIRSVRGYVSFLFPQPATIRLSVSLYTYSDLEVFPTHSVQSEQGGGARVPPFPEVGALKEPCAGSVGAGVCCGFVVLLKGDGRHPFE